MIRISSSLCKGYPHKHEDVVGVLHVCLHTALYVSTRKLTAVESVDE